MPRWTAPPRVPKRLLDWWRRIVAFIATHEAGHVRIGREYTKRLNARLAGKDCADVPDIIQAWAKQHAAAQEAYDRSEYSKPWPQPATGY
jgi:predicted secreted Zn-dependent protease